MKVIFFQKLNSLWMKKLEPIMEEFPSVEFITDPQEAEANLQDADVLVGGKPEREELERAKRLSLIVVPFAGINHLPLDLLQQRGVRVANSHGNARYVAERTVGLLLAFFGKIIEYHDDLRLRTKWHGFWVGRGLDDTWESLHGKSCVVLGTGEIGRALAVLLRPFGVRMIGYKRSRMKEPPEGFDEMVYDLDKAIDAGDIVVVALPATDATVGLLDRRRLSRMEGKFLVNIGRGNIVEEKALYDVLAKRVLRGAAIDCWYSYPQGGVEGEPSNYPIRELENVVLSPHIAGFTAQSVERNVEQAVENLAGFLRNGSPRFEAHSSEGY